MIDFHCHILPGIDDGSANMEESLRLARQSVEAGVTHVVATPHGSSENIEQILADRDKNMELLKEQLKANDIQLELIPGLEYMADGHSDTVALDYPHCRCGFNPADNSPLLLELNFSMDLPFIGDILFKAQIKGVPLVLAHPERYNRFVENTSMLMNLMDKGLYLQFNANNFRKSFFFFNSIPKMMYKLIEHNPDNILIGSDAHNPDMRPAGFASAEKHITARLGADVWKKISLENPRRLLRF